MEENQDFNLLPPYLVDSDGAQSPESQTQRTYGTLSYGVESQVFGLQVVTGSNITVGQKGGNDTSFYVTIGGKF